MSAFIIMIKREEKTFDDGDGQWTAERERERERERE